MIRGIKCLGNGAFKLESLPPHNLGYGSFWLQSS